MKHSGLIALAASLIAGAANTSAQNAQPLTETGQTVVDGRPTNYVIHHLPPNSFPDLPAIIAEQLARRDCLIPQTYAAHRPENVIHASLEHAGTSDWAVLCSAHGVVSLLVFFSSAPEKPIVLAIAPETAHLQPYGATTTLGFNWGIDAASPAAVHQAQAGLARRPPAPDHDALADSVVDHQTVYHFFAREHWTLLDMPPD
ncbi:MAG TPA: hypothetical protein VE291_02135 [Terracidiphilus sp.]|jgi:hypothetical protein|nr:hypothetical protein [Terracidiphilus sp.]